MTRLARSTACTPTMFSATAKARQASLMAQSAPSESAGASCCM